ncbi:MAG: GNAT family N-acetyltransferase [Alphaproteobacteria bacterium]|nr:GNAT family N-acetyltransferase [Alphaproteobacteria bacterium]
MSVTIRPLADTDRADWEERWRNYLVFYEAELPPAQTETTWARLMDPAGDPHGLVAVDDGGKMIGITHYLFHVSTWLMGPTCYLQDLYVDEAARRTGAGRALIEAVYAAADAAGASQVYWLTQHFNDTARQLYDRVGKATPFMKYNRS